MTSDYVSWALGLQGWQRAWKEDSYFAGEEDTLGNGSLCEFDEEHNEYGDVSATVNEIGCQTPSEWADFGPAQRAKEELPKLAPARLVVLTSGQV